jgi:hypothetical protein
MHDVRPHYKGLGLVILFVGKERTLQIVGEYDYQVLLPLIVVVYNFLNPSDASVVTFGSTSHSVKPTSLYNFMETNKEMASSMN